METFFGHNSQGLGSEYTEAIVELGPGLEQPQPMHSWDG